MWFHKTKFYCMQDWIICQPKYCSHCGPRTGVESGDHQHIKTLSWSCTHIFVMFSILVAPWVIAVEAYVCCDFLPWISENFCCYWLLHFNGNWHNFLAFFVPSYLDSGESRYYSWKFQVLLHLASLFDIIYKECKLFSCIFP